MLAPLYMRQYFGKYTDDYWHSIAIFALQSCLSVERTFCLRVWKHSNTGQMPVSDILNTFVTLNLNARTSTMAHSELLTWRYHGEDDSSSSIVQQEMMAEIVKEGILNLRSTLWRLLIGIEFSEISVFLKVTVAFWLVNVEWRWKYCNLSFTRHASTGQYCRQ